MKEINSAGNSVPCVKHTNFPCAYNCSTPCHLNAEDVEIKKRRRYFLHHQCCDRCRLIFPLLTRIAHHLRHQSLVNIVVIVTMSPMSSQGKYRRTPFMIFNALMSAALISMFMKLMSMWIQKSGYTPSNLTPVCQISYRALRNQIPQIRVPQNLYFFVSNLSERSPTNIWLFHIQSREKKQWRNIMSFHLTHLCCVLIMAEAWRRF